MCNTVTHTHFSTLLSLTVMRHVPSLSSSLYRPVLWTITELIPNVNHVLFFKQHGYGLQQFLISADVDRIIKDKKSRIAGP